MKKKIVWYALPVLLMISGLLYSFYFFTPPSLVVETYPQNTNLADYEAKFQVNNLPTVTGANSGIRLFISHGDGSYKIGNAPQMTGHTHQYRTSPLKQAFAEVIAFYDDKKKPPERTALSGSININPSPSLPPPASLGSNKVQLKKTCSVVPGDSITYIITYEHKGGCNLDMAGEINFTYDDDVFTFIQGDIFNSESLTPTLITGANSTITRKFTFSALKPGEQRNIFVLLETKETVNTTTTFEPTKVDLTFTSPGNVLCPGEMTYNNEITGEKIESSHDPNHKTIVENALCGNDYVVWRIDFQNEGNAAEDTVVVADWIDTLLDFNTVQLVGYHPSPQVLDIKSSSAKREYRFALYGIDLRGLGETNANDNDTRGYVLVKAKRKSFQACNAVANNARIFFGCNPPVTTETVLAPFPCADTICTPCSQLFDTTLVVKKIPLAGGTSLLKNSDPPFGLVANLQTAPWVFKWYPSKDLSDPLILNPTVTKPVRRVYTLVASFKSPSPPFICQRFVVRVPVEPAAPLKLNIETICTDQQPLWTLTATASNFVTASNLVWQNCTSGDTWTKDKLDPQTVYVAVWDTETEQYAEQWVNLPLSCPLPPCPVSNGVWVALGGIVLAALLFRYLMRKR